MTTSGQPSTSVFNEPYRPTQPPTLRGTGKDYRPEYGNVLRLGSRDRYDSNVDRQTCGWQVKLCDPTNTHARTQARTHTHTLNGPLSGTTPVSWYQKGKTNLDFTEARDSEWQWHQLGHMQVCTSLQTDNHASTTPLSFFTGRMPFLPPNQQRQSTEGTH